MPSNRRRMPRVPRLTGPSPAELEWLTGQPQPGANRFWRHVRGAAKIERCMTLMQEHAALIPLDRLSQRDRDLQFWS